MKCLNCENLMANEGYIGDDIQLCHACYDTETLVKYYPRAEEIGETITGLVEKLNN